MKSKYFYRFSLLILFIIIIGCTREYVRGGEQTNPPADPAPGAAPGTAGAAGAPGQAGTQGERGGDGNAGGNCWDEIGDTNGDGTQNSLDCLPYLKEDCSEGERFCFECAKGADGKCITTNYQETCSAPNSGCADTCYDSTISFPVSDCKELCNPQCDNTPLREKIRVENNYASLTPEVCKSDYCGNKVCNSENLTLEITADEDCPQALKMPADAKRVNITVTFCASQWHVLKIMGGNLYFSTPSYGTTTSSTRRVVTDDRWFVDDDYADITTTSFHINNDVGLSPYCQGLGALIDGSAPNAYDHKAKIDLKMEDNTTKSLIWRDPAWQSFNIAKAIEPAPDFSKIYSVVFDPVESGLVKNNIANMSFKLFFPHTYISNLTGLPEFAIEGKFWSEPIVKLTFSLNYMELKNQQQ